MVWPSYFTIGIRFDPADSIFNLENQLFKIVPSLDAIVAPSRLSGMYLPT